MPSTVYIKKSKYRPVVESKIDYIVYLRLAEEMG